MVRKNTQKRLFLLASLAMFSGSTLIATLRLYTTATPAPEMAQTQALETDSLTEQARGYETVLQREPNNQTALEGLANTRLQMQDAKGAIAPLEKLVKLNPERADYKALLTEVKQRHP
jgi:cytochrome c-type biogenesis protein CcmH/NrfG